MNMQIKKRAVRFLFLAALAVSIPLSSFAGVFISVTIAPPVLPVYTQPPCPGDGYLWTPGYWAWGAAGYYWVPGTWVIAPRPGLLWTPGYWGWGGGRYIWHVGYWGPHVGFYGGVNYGFGYAGAGFVGGEWRGGTFFYNRSVTNVNVTNVHIYNRTVINRVTVNRVSFNGGAGGISARPSHEEQIAMRERHVALTSMQAQHEHAASANHALLASVNHGRPEVAATSRPGEFQGRTPAAPRAAGAPARPQNRPMGQQSMNRSVPRPQTSDRSLGRPGPGPARSPERPATARQESVPRPAASRAENNRPQPHANAYRPENNRPQPHANASRPENNRTQARESVPRPENDGKGREQKSR